MNARRGFLWGIALLFSFAVVVWKIVVPIAVMAPSTNHHKNVRPFSAAIELEVGKQRAASLVIGERLDYCSYVPVEMCVKLYLRQDQMDERELAIVREIARNVCQIFQHAGVGEMSSIAAKHGLDEKQYRQTLRSFAGCDPRHISYYREGPESVRIDQGVVVLTLFSLPTSANQVGTSPKESK